MHISALTQHTRVSRRHFLLVSEQKGEPLYDAAVTHTYRGRCYNFELWLCSYHWGNPAEPSISVQHKQNNIIYTGLQTSEKTPWCKHVQRHTLLVKKNRREKKEVTSLWPFTISSNSPTLSSSDPHVLGCNVSPKDSEVPELRWDKRTLPSSMCGHMVFCASAYACVSISPLRGVCERVQFCYPCL